MKISKNRFAEMQTKVKNALARARAAKDTDAGEMVLTVGEGLAAGVASSFAIGMIPVPASMPKPGLIKSGVQVALGVGLALAVKNKHARNMGYGMALLGGMGVMREMFPIPTFAGEVDESMFGIDWTPEGGGGYSGMGEPLGEPLGAEVNPFG